MITCPKCSKENQDHYKFCLGCGAELPRGQAPKPFSPQTPPQGVAAAARGSSGTGAAAAPGGVLGGGIAAAALGGGATIAAPMAGAGQTASIPRASVPAAAPAAAPRPPMGSQPPPGPAVVSPSQPAPAGTVSCPQCGHANTTNNRFCASCGYNLGALQAAAVPAVAAAAPAAGGSSVVLTALRADGSEAGSYRLPEAATVPIGRDTGSIFAGDSYLSPRHASFSRRSSQLFVKDESSLNGVYLKLKPNEPWPLNFDDIFRIGQEIVRFEELKPQPKSNDGVDRFGSPSKGYIGRIALVIGRDTTGNAFPIPARGIHCGRERGDVLFSEDGYVSGLHCRIHRAQDGKVYLTDVGSSNGTFVRIRSEHALRTADILLMGQQLFRVDF